MTARELTDILTPRVPKRFLLFVAATMWGLGGFKISHIAFQAFIQSHPNYFIIAPVVIVGYLVFFKFMFLKIFKKHSTRIINKKKEWNCMFSFLDLRGYLIMAFMIVMGVSLRKSGLIPLVPLGVVYGIMGLTLMTAALRFFEAGIRYNHYVSLFKTNN